MKTSFSPTLLSRGPLGPMMGTFEPGIGPVRLKIDPCRPHEDPPEHVNCLFSLNFDSERLQYIIVRIEKGPLGSERGGVKFHPFPPTGCATAFMKSCCYCDWNIECLAG